MFYLSEFLVNYNNFKFGQTQFKYVINDIILPNLAKGNYNRLFVKMNKKL